MTDHDRRSGTSTSDWFPLVGSEFQQMLQTWEFVFNGVDGSKWFVIYGRWSLKESLGDLSFAKI